MDTSFLAPGPITWPALVACVVALWGLAKAVDWAIGKLKTGTDRVVSPLTIDMAAAKLDIRALDDKLNAFKIEVARTYVTGDVITRLEKRIDDMVSAVHDEMRDMREAVLKAIMERR